MFSALSVIVLGDSRARPLHVSRFSWFFPSESNVRGCWVEALNLKVLGLALLR